MKLSVANAVQGPTRHGQSRKSMVRTLLVEIFVIIPMPDYSSDYGMKTSPTLRSRFADQALHVAAN